MVGANLVSIALPKVAENIFFFLAPKAIHGRPTTLVCSFTNPIHN